MNVQELPLSALHLLGFTLCLKVCAIIRHAGRQAGRVMRYLSLLDSLVDADIYGLDILVREQDVARCVSD